jgi:hypothetical protein
LLRAANLVHGNQEEYISILFYASWCPFSKICMPNFRKLSTVFPSIRHFAFEESVIRPRFKYYHVICCFISVFPTYSSNSFIEFIVFPNYSSNSFIEFIVIGICCSILARYGVHGFPTLFLLNSTMRVRYRGPRTRSSLIAFYNNVTSEFSFFIWLSKIWLVTSCFFNLRFSYCCIEGTHFYHICTYIQTYFKHLHMFEFTVRFF